MRKLKTVLAPKDTWCDKAIVSFVYYDMYIHFTCQ